MRPVIGVTGPDTRFPTAWWFIRWAIWRSGGRPLRLTPRGPEPSAPLDGMVISGGDDIDPSLYLGADNGVAPKDTPRDKFEVAMIGRALADGLPMLGICRGAQLINVVLGGTLHADIRHLRRITSNRRTPFPLKTLELTRNSRLQTLMSCERSRINSLHHQAIDRLGSELTICGRDRDGIVQAVEHRDERFLFGVQWHPEYLPQKSEQRRLFQALCEAARA